MPTATGELSYELHTGRELDLMKSGNKPLAYFYQDADSLPEEESVPENEFDIYVQNGLLSKGEEMLQGAIHPLTGRPVRTRYVLYSLRREEWRINAMKLVLQTMIRTKRRPDEGLDRLVGSLLGYTNEQNDEYIASGRY